MWTLKVIKGAELADKLVALVRLPQPLQRFSIGRDPANPWAINDRTLALSARHCEIVDSPAGPLLRDLSTNGTFVNGAAARMSGDHPLRDGDRIELGPYLIEVSGPPMPAQTPPPARPAAATPPQRSPGVLDTAPHRGGDPAAMLALGGGGARQGLTEMLRVAKPSEDSNVDLTKIRMAPPAPARSTRIVEAPTPTTAVPRPPPVPAAQPVPPAAATAPVATPALVEALARGLGVEPRALAGQDPLLLAERLALAARASAAALRQLMEHQSQARRDIGSRQSVLGPLSSANPLRAAPSAELALLGLVAGSADPAAVLQRSAEELCQHQDRLLKAFHGAAQRLGEQITPESLQAALQQSTTTSAGAQAEQAEQARLWQFYTAVWSGLGLAPDQGWAAGFREAALQHLAAAYDELLP